MYRNLSKRIEVVTPVQAPAAERTLWEVLDILLRDRRQAWTPPGLDASDIGPNQELTYDLVVFDAFFNGMFRGLPYGWDIVAAADV